MVEIYFGIWGGGMLVIAVSFVWAQGQFMASLQYSHGAVWQKLGRPTMFSSDMNHQLRLMRYIAAAEYRNLPDSRMRLYADTMRYSIAAMFVWFAVGLLCLSVFG